MIGCISTLIPHILSLVSRTPAPNSPHSPHSVPWLPILTFTDGHRKWYFNEFENTFKPAGEAAIEVFGKNSFFRIAAPQSIKLSGFSIPSKNVPEGVKF